MPCCGRQVFITSPARWAPTSTPASFGNCATTNARFISPSMLTPMAAANNPRRSLHTVSWRECAPGRADTTLRTYAHNRLHVVRGWESIHPTGDIVEGDLSESTLLDYVRFQSSQQPRPSASLINDRVAVTDRALRNEFPNA